MRSFYALLLLVLLAIGLVACGSGHGKTASSGGSPDIVCNVSERFAQHPVVGVLAAEGVDVRFVAPEEAPAAQTVALADQLVADARAERLQAAATASGGGPGGDQSGGTNAPVAGGDTNTTVFCGKDANPIFTGPGGTTNKNSGNTTSTGGPEAKRGGRS